MTPLVYSTQNGSKVVGVALGDSEGLLLGEALGVADGEADGEDDGEELGEALGVAEGAPDDCASVSKSQIAPVPAQPTINV